MQAEREPVRHCVFLCALLMATETDTSGGGGSSTSAGDEPPFSAEQLAWIGRLIAERHSAGADPPAAGGDSGGVQPSTSSAISGELPSQ